MIIIVYVVIAIVFGAIGVKYMHNDKPAPQHQLECTQKGEKAPTCKCETLEAEKVVIKP